MDVGSKGSPKLFFRKFKLNLNVIDKSADGKVTHIIKSSIETLKQLIVGSLTHQRSNKFNHRARNGNNSPLSRYQCHIGCTISSTSNKICILDRCIWVPQYNHHVVLDYHAIFDERLDGEHNKEMNRTDLIGQFYKREY